MTRFAHTARRRFGQVSSSITNASRHFVPPKLSSWKLALYLIVFLLPGGSFAVLGMGWFENRHKRRTAASKSATSVATKTKPSTAPTLLPSPCSGGGAGGV